ncbi:MAG: preprotein translocase subunit SecG [candidate division Zixibacteria bacterium]|nr:preprotein translocase subunit SecG [candidate division Zixibacteria bacterium]
MYGLLIILHVLICIGLIITVLMQSSKGEGLAGAFGGSGITGAVFGGRGAATFLSKATTVLAVAFFLSSIGLSFITPLVGPRGGGKSAITEEAQKERSQGPFPATNVPGATQETQTQEGQKTELPPSLPEGEGK